MPQTNFSQEHFFFCGGRCECGNHTVDGESERLGSHGMGDRRGGWKVPAPVH